MILAGDIGGTTTRLALFEANGTKLQLVVEQSSPNRYYDSLGDIVLNFATSSRHKVRHACFGIAGPIQNDVVRAPNLPWLIEARSLAETLRLNKVILINDLEANAYGIGALEREELVTLNPGDSNARGNAAVISAGTGLGEAGLFWDGKEYQPFACEGGHADFAPGNELEAELFQYLRGIFGHVSWERVLSGPGLHNVYKFLRDTRRGGEASQIQEEMLNADPAVVISKAAMEGRCSLCVAALDLFVSLYGAAAGNLALKMMARGGVFLGGGIAPKIVNKLKGASFMRSFVAKGRMKPLMESIPVQVLMNDKTALLGAALYALRASLLCRRLL